MSKGPSIVEQDRPSLGTELILDTKKSHVICHLSQTICILKAVSNYVMYA